MEENEKAMREDYKTSAAEMLELPFQNVNIMTDLTTHTIYL